VCLAIMGLCLAARAMGQGTAGGTRTEVIAWLRGHAIDLPLGEPTSEPALAAALVAIDSLTRVARVVAMGEATHGTHEFLELRNQIFESLVSQGVTAIALETGFQDALAIDAFIQSPGAEPPPDSIARAVVAYSNDGHGNGRTENRELLRWLHEFNSTHPRQRVHLYGFDLSGRTASGGFINAARTVTEALAYVQRVDSSEAQRLRARLSSRLNGFQSRSYAMKDKAYDHLSVADRSTISEVITDLATDFRLHAAAWRNATSNDEYWVAMRLSNAALQLDGFFRRNLGQGGMPPNATAYRDSAMGANARAIADHVAPGRLFIFAHDVHVQAGGGQLNDGPGRSMGSWLRAELGENLFVFGAIDGLRHVGDSIATTVVGDSASLPSVCSDVGRPAFVANLRALPSAGTVRDWFTEPRKVNPVAFAQAASYMINALRWYDAIVFVRDVHIGRPGPISNSTHP